MWGLSVQLQFLGVALISGGFAIFWPVTLATTQRIRRTHEEERGTRIADKRAHCALCSIRHGCNDWALI